MKLLVLAAHPDDEVLGCGGLLSRTLREGGEATVLIFTEGASAQYPDDTSMAERKRSEARSAADRLGGVRLEFLEHPELALETVSPRLLHDQVRATIDRCAPDWVVVHHPGDLNRDHRRVHEAGSVVCRPRSGAVTPRLLTFETLSSTEWGTPPFVPSVFVRLDASDLERKVGALESYRSELRDWPHPRSPEAVEALARRRGSQAGVTLAEAFSLTREVMG